MTGYANTGYGYAALYSNTSGWGNTASGTAALAQNTTGHYNTGNGSHALAQNTIGSDNTADGYFALFYNTNDGNNIALGYQAGINIQGNNNIDVGNQGMGGTTTPSALAPLVRTPTLLLPASVASPCRTPPIPSSWTRSVDNSAPWISALWSAPPEPRVLKVQLVPKVRLGLTG